MASDLVVMGQFSLTGLDRGLEAPPLIFPRELQLHRRVADILFRLVPALQRLLQVVPDLESLSDLGNQTLGLLYRFSADDSNRGGFLVFIDKLPDVSHEALHGTEQRPTLLTKAFGRIAGPLCLDMPGGNEADGANTGDEGAHDEREVRKHGPQDC